LRTPFAIREAEPADQEELAALERAAPESGRLALQVDLGVGYLELAARYPGVRSYLALAPDTQRIVGMLFSSLAPTQLNGAVVPGTYLFSLRVHPAWRRRGIASALLAHARERARTEAGAVVAWAAIVDGNDTSLWTFASAGFEHLARIGIRIALPVPRWAHPIRRWTAQPATRADLPALADMFNAAHAAHNFWRPCTPEGLGAELQAARHTLADVTLVRDPGGAILAAAAAFDVSRVARLRLLGLRALPGRLNRALAVVAGRLPLLPVLLRHRALPADQPDAGLVVLRSIQRQRLKPFSVLATPMDTRDPAWPLVAKRPGLTAWCHVVARSDAPVDRGRPVYVG
jgi:ribosomal protein S18 acetylase RimI-like enzyme